MTVEAKNDAIQAACGFLKQYDSFVLIAHISPDGDTLGSCLALSYGLQKAGKQCTVVCEDRVPAALQFLPGQETIVRSDKAGEPEIVVSVDCADADRTGSAKALLLNAKHTLCIDHHRTNEGFGECNCVLVTSSTGEIIVRILKEMQIRIDEDIAINLYTAITTDTGNLAYKGTTPETFRIMADVVESGIDISELNQKIFRSEPFKKMKLRALMIEKTKLYNKKRIGIACLTLDDLKSLHCSSEDVEGLIDSIRDIDTVEVAALLKEGQNGTVRVSLRGKKNADVSVLAKKYRGGGHKLAAGCTLEMRIGEAMKCLKNELPSCLGE